MAARDRRSVRGALAADRLRAAPAAAARSARRCLDGCCGPAQARIRHRDCACACASHQHGARPRPQRGDLGTVETVPDAGAGARDRRDCLRGPDVSVGGEVWARALADRVRADLCERRNRLFPAGDQPIVVRDEGVCAACGGRALPGGVPDLPRARAARDRGGWGGCWPDAGLGSGPDAAVDG